ncbi:MAG: hypothetical protein OXF02_03610 [Simkaniaceae bacterium]|nr:hypothetical protein [Simkaniaceae bacterium]
MATQSGVPVVSESATKVSDVGTPVSLSKKGIDVAVQVTDISREILDVHPDTIERGAWMTTRKERIGFRILLATLAVGLPSVALASVLGAVYGGTTGLAVGVSLTSVPTVGALLVGGGVVCTKEMCKDCAGGGVELVAETCGCTRKDAVETNNRQAEEDVKAKLEKACVVESPSPASVSQSTITRLRTLPETFSTLKSDNASNMGSESLSERERDTEVAVELPECDVEGNPPAQAQTWVGYFSEILSGAPAVQDETNKESSSPERDVEPTESPTPERLPERDTEEKPLLPEFATVQGPVWWREYFGELVRIAVGGSAEEGSPADDDLAGATSV